jgi:protein tyrosine/serine phosphatase
MSKFTKNVIFLSFCLSTTSANLIQSAKENSPHWQKFRQTFDNFAVVEPGKLYRSKQLDAKRFDFYIKKYGIKTIVNLRGENPNKKWWQQEKMVTQKNNIKFYNIPMNANKLPKKENVIKLLDIYDKAPTPILIHCQAGANRTGEAAALWKLYKQKESKQKALEQLNIKYGHLKSRNNAKDFFISIWQGRDWLEKHYDPKKYPAFN